MPNRPSLPARPGQQGAWTIRTRYGPREGNEVAVTSFVPKFNLGTRKDMKIRLSIRLLVILTAVLASKVRASAPQPVPASDTQIAELFRDNAEEQIVIVEGRVRTPCLLHIKPGEKLMLSEVLLRAGGFSGFHAPVVRVFRLKDGTIGVFNFALHLEKPDQDILVAPGDIIEVR